MQESNLRCSCGEPLYKGDNILHHTTYYCLTCNNFYVVKGQDHYWIHDEIDLDTGKIIPMKETEKGKKYLLKENKRLRNKKDIIYGE